MSEWVLEFVYSLLNSPEWEVPVMQFIDENCVVFDNDDENKLSYTEIHQEFRSLVETILETHLVDIGVDSDTFAGVCKDTGSTDELSKTVMTQIFAMDDFMTFKRLMVKRNMELEVEAFEAIKEENERSREKQDSKGTPSEAKEEKCSFEIEDGSDDDVVVDEEDDDDEELQASMEAHMLEMEMRYQEEELELADLETAIALSLQIEDARIRSEQEAKAESKDHSGATSLQSEPKSKEAEEAIKKSRKALDEGRQRHKELQEQQEVSEDDMDRRKKHLRAQRDRLLAKKKKERERQLEAFQQEKKAATPSATSEIPKAEKAETKSSDAEERRTALRIALARRMKQDLIESEDFGSSNGQSHQYADLDTKLRQVEALRQENRMQEERMYRDVMKQQQRRG